MRFLKHLYNCLKIIIFLGSIGGCWRFFYARSHRHSDSLIKKNSVRVLLATYDLPLKKPIAIGTQGTFFTLLYDKKNVKISGSSIAISEKRGKLHMAGKVWSSTFELYADGHLSHEDKVYEGSFRLLLHEGKILLINELPLESYIYSVLKTESWPGWPLEVNKAFAITSRTYVVSMMLEADRLNRLYDVRNCNRHQTYAGVHDTKVLHDAVQKTKGIILTYQEKPIRAMFDSCCGGIIPARMQGVAFEDAPYLARNYPCTFCKQLRIFRWRASYSLKDLADRLKKICVITKPIRSIGIAEKDDAGVVQKIEIITGGKKITLSGKDFYQALKEVKSFVWDFSLSKGVMQISGYGYGHHLGLCQWGAREMVREGYNYKQILHFYYPNVKQTSM